MELISAMSTLLAGGVHSVNLARAALGVHDFNAASLQLAKLNEQLLDAQQHLFKQGEAMLALQAENGRLREDVRNLQEKIAQRSQYKLFDLGGGEFVYRSVEANPEHYVCQRCFDAGTRSVLLNRGRWYCSVCSMGFGPDRGDNVMTIPRVDRWSDY